MKHITRIVRLPPAFLRASLFVLLTAWFGVGCASVPLTNRSQLQLVAPAQMMSLSNQQYQNVLKTAKLSDDKANLALIKKVGGQISSAVDDFVRERNINMKFNWEFQLIDDKTQVNAWCMPGGKVAFYTGILPYTQDENGIAVVMGHEVAHALARHGSERFSQGMLAQVGTTILAEALSQKPAATQRLFLGAVGMGTQVGVLLPFSRLHESEADHIGLILMAKAGYDPRHAIPFWQRMSNSGGSRPPEFLSTHPAGATRIEAIKKHLPEAMQYYRAAVAESM